ncbi:MAG: hypothetical protein JOZ18_11560 [Chloroflexi bacterium]|nr:hypothetical protein [Chloroflexota bacterium]
MKKREQKALKRLFIILVLTGMITLLLVACGTTTSTSGSTENVVQMNDTNFVQSSITIKKGERVTLINDSPATPHIIANGTWVNGSTKPAREPGAPEVKSLQIGGNGSDTVGPFNTTGTFQFYCTIHPGMNLTVVVQ